MTGPALKQSLLERLSALLAAGVEGQAKANELLI